MSKELAIINLISQLTGQPEALADDAFWDADNRLIYTTDMLVENRHFNTDYFSPEALGWKAAAVNISDIAAMGGQLKYLLISLGLPDSIGLDWIQAFYKGLLSACQRFGGHIAGGDTVSSDQITINVTAVGVCPPGHTVGRRYNAQAGDYVIATGFHGLSQLGLMALQQNLPNLEACKAAHLHPMPKIEAGLMLSAKYERYALMDSSDGLADALIKIAQASGKTLRVNQDAIPVHSELAAYWQTANNPQALWQSILYGGEDFELVATVPQVDAEVLAHFHVLGRVEEAPQEPGAWLLESTSGKQQALSLSQAYQHFQASHA